MHPITPTVSIIMPMYNAAPTVAEAIESAWCQTWPQIELILVDDGSTDDSLAAARACLDRLEAAAKDSVKTGETTVLETRTARLISQANAGASAARNRGLREATGEYIQYLDADDLLAADKIALQMHALEKTPPGTVAACSWGKFSNGIADATIVPQPVWHDFARPLDWLIDAWEGGGMMQTACWLTPRTVAEAAGPWDETLERNPADDGEYFCRVLLCSKGVRFCESARVYYRAPGKDNVSRQLCPAATESLFMNCERYREHALAIDNSDRVRHAVAVNYANFIYRFHPMVPDLVQRARKRLTELGYDVPPTVGGKWFRRIASLIGFDHALRLRAVIRQRLI